MWKVCDLKNPDIFLRERIGNQSPDDDRLMWVSRFFPVDWKKIMILSCDKTNFYWSLLSYQWMNITISNTFSDVALEPVLIKATSYNSSYDSLTANLKCHDLKDDLFNVNYSSNTFPSLPGSSQSPSSPLTLHQPSSYASPHSPPHNPPEHIIHPCGTYGAGKSEIS